MVRNSFFSLTTNNVLSFAVFSRNYLILNRLNVNCIYIRCRLRSSLSLHYIYTKKIIGPVPSGLQSKILSHSTAISFSFYDPPIPLDLTIPERPCASAHGIT